MQRNSRRVVCCADPVQQRPTFSSEGMPRRLAVAPVAMMTECALMVRSLLVMVKGRTERSTLSTSSVCSSAPQRSACSTDQHTPPGSTSSKCGERSCCCS